MTQWEIRGREMVNCNCNYGCPCQFGVLPTHGTCEAALLYEIDEGYYGDVRLDGLRAAAVYRWPGAIHEGNGHMQLVIDSAASAEQRAALEKILTGQDTEEMATHWFVFGAMSPNKHDTIIAPIDLEMDAKNRIGHGRAGDVFDMDVKPIPNIVSGDPHRVRIDLTHGFEFTQAECASGGTRITGGAVSFGPLEDSHAYFARLHMTGKGLVRGSAAAA